MEKIVIYGNGFFAETVYRFITFHKLFEIVSFCCDRQYLKEDKYFGLPMVAFEEVQDIYPTNTYSMYAAIGYSVMRNRKLMFDKAKAKGYKLINIIGPRAINYEDFEIGENNFIDDGSFIGETGKLADNNVFRRFVSIGHNFQVGSHNFISAGVNIGGFSRIGNSCFFGLGAIVKNETTIEDETLIGAGAVIIHDTEAFSAYVGNPARKIKSHKETGILINH